MQEDNNKNIVKNLVISGGGVAGLSFYGAIKQLHKDQHWQLKNIENIYATSVGTIISILISLDYEWDELDNFIIKRPWNKVFKFDLSTIFNAIENRGLFNINVIRDSMRPILLGKDIELDITMKEFYNVTGINMYFMSVEMNTMSVVNMSHKTHPDWKLLDAVYCSASLPVCFAPYLYENNYLCDGGFKVNYPIQICLDDGNKEEETIGIGFNSIINSFHKEPDKEENISKYNLFDYLISLLLNLIRSFNIRSYNNSLYKEVLLDANFHLFHKIYDIINNEDLRAELIEYGVTNTKD